MRLLKNVFLALVLLAIALFAAAYQMPLQLEVEQSIVLPAKPEQVYKYLENPMQWEKWSALNTAADPTMIRMYGGPLAGAGARMQWSGDKVGTGEVVFTESINPQVLSYTQTDSYLDTVSEGSISLEPATGGNTLIRWKHAAPVKDEPVARLMGYWKKYKKQAELDGGLIRLKSLFEENTTGPASKRKVASAK
ncbi:SRPBCC family protein [uncultured Pontibacter sp.]|uniref:SRPBCC family protein n=1 Tax=uncultured Pontibacter sp. TaxID=453356 RepID=UPI0026029EAB|nr:SRPBCC family protein [uncultured Pontibacter sp.]